MSEYDKYLNVILGECVDTFDENILKVGKRYRLGIRHNNLLNKKVYYLLDIKDFLGFPIYVEIERGYFKEEEINSISFILT